MKILNFGSLNYDYIYSVDHVVKEGETISSSKRETVCGGKGLNQSVALARAGASVYHAGMIGEDGTELLNVCKANGIDTSNISIVEGESGHTIIQVDKEGQNCIILYGGSNQKITKEYVDKVFGNFEKDDIIILQNEINLVDYIIEEAYKKGLKIILNPSPYDFKLEKCDLSKISIFILNEVEGEQITGEKEPEKILNKMLSEYPNSKIVLTLGSAGVMYKDKEQEYYRDIYKVKIVDTTAAGDTFTGYFIASLIKNFLIEEALGISAKAAAIAVTKAGATTSIPFMEDVIKAEI
jgi:Sugar kinases, ribokinase family